jgi:DNA-binding NarL/FixJ family response regulator
MQQIRLLLVDDHTVVRQGLRALFRSQPDIVVVGEADNGRQAVRMTRDLLPDVIVMDIAMPLLNGLEATRQIAKEVPSTKVLVLSAYDNPEYVRQVTKAGAVGYLLKQSAVTELIKAVREIRNGNAWFSPAISQHVLPRFRDTLPGTYHLRRRTESLTTREAEVLQLIAEGAPNKQIAAELCISIKTVEKHRQQVMNKLNIHDIAGLTRYAISLGIVEFPLASNDNPNSVSSRHGANSQFRRGLTTGILSRTVG